MRKLRHICDGSAKLSWKNNCISKRADSGMAQKYVPAVTKKLYSGGTAGESGRFSSWIGTQKESERSHGTPDTSPFRLLSQAIYCSGCYQGLIPDTKPHNRINKIIPIGFPVGIFALSEIPVKIHLVEICLYLLRQYSFINHCIHIFGSVTIQSCHGSK